MGSNVLFAILNQINENAQNIIARKIPPYILNLFFTGPCINLFWRANLILIILFYPLKPDFKIANFRQIFRLIGEMTIVINFNSQKYK